MDMITKNSIETKLIKLQSLKKNEINVGIANKNINIYTIYDKKIHSFSIVTCTVKIS